MPEHDNVDRASGICALRSLFGDSLAPGARAGWPSSLGNGRAADTREERERCRKWRRAALCAFVDDGPRRPWWLLQSLPLCKVRLLQSLPLC